jgi:hypothetical protein
MDQPLDAASPSAASSPPPLQSHRIITTADELDAALASLNITTITTNQLIEAIRDEQRKRGDEGYRKRVCPFASIRTSIIPHPIFQLRKEYHSTLMGIFVPTLSTNTETPRGNIDSRCLSLRRKPFLMARFPVYLNLKRQQFLELETSRSVDTHPQQMSIELLHLSHAATFFSILSELWGHSADIWEQ